MHNKPHPALFTRVRSLVAMFSALAFTNLGLSIPAFPGAEGYGSTTPGGRGGTVIKVVNLNDSGPGSFRAAVTASGPRIVVFTVYGTIQVESQIVISNPFITIAGQSAPGGGITIRNRPTSPTTMQMPLKIATHDVVMRYMRIRPGTPSTIPPLNAAGDDPGNTDGMNLGNDTGTNCYNIIIDHCSFSWSTDEVLTTSANTLTLSWNIISEGLDNSTHPDGRHSKGMMFVQGEGEPAGDADNISMHHNLLAHNLDRNPVINSSGKVDMVNNVFYNAIAWTQVKNKWATAQANIVKNYYKKGPDYVEGPGTYKQSINGWEVIMARDAGGSTLHPQAYLLGNIGWHRPTDTGAQDLIVRESTDYPFNPEDDWLDIVTTRFSTPTITSETSATAAYTAMIDTALGKGPGANLRLKSTSPYDLSINARDTVDARIISEVAAGTGSIKNSVPGWATMASGGVATDADSDGMPDAWESANGVTSANADKNGDGYTNIEAYLYGINP